MIKTTIPLLVILSLLIVTGSCADDSNNATSQDEVSVEQVSTSVDEVESSIKEERAAFELFNDINGVRNKLSTVGIGTMTYWGFDDYSEFYSITPYYEFGGGTPPNNLAFYLDSEKPNYIKTLKLVVNINNGNKRAALSKFASIIEKTYGVLNIRPNSQIISAAKKGEEITIQNELYSETIMLEKTRIETWKFIIETR